MCGRRHAAVRWLTKKLGFKGVDRNFLLLVKQIHRIPDCATFGVSCSGHIGFVRVWPNPKPELDQCALHPNGDLCLMVNTKKAHAKALLEVISQIVADVPDATFGKKVHAFGPEGEDHPLEVWEISFGRDGCLDALGESYYGQSLNPADHPAVYRLATQRYRLIKRTWHNLGRAVQQFADDRAYPPLPNIAARRAEQIAAWERK